MEPSGLLYCLWEGVMGLEKANVARRVPTDIAVVVFGMDRSKKRHASRFGSDMASKAEEAAKVSGMTALRIVTDDQRQIAMKLPKGTVSASGRAVVPLVKSVLYDKLLAVADKTPAADVPPTDPKQPSGNPSSTMIDQMLEDAQPPDDWSKLKKGSLVLALENVEEGWFEAVVINIVAEKVTLQWRDFPAMPTFTRTTAQLAFRHPAMQRPC